MEIAHARVVFEDLEFLSKQWSQEIDQPSLRRASTTLNTLLIEDNLQVVGRDLGIDVRIMARPNEGALALEGKDYCFWQAGGAMIKGVIIGSVSLPSRALTAVENAAVAAAMQKNLGENIPVKISSFLRQPSFIVDGILINREEVIKYVANKLGGKHYDSTRKKNSKSQVSLDDKYSLLDSVHSKMQFLDKNSIYYELLSIGQFLNDSPDVQRLRTTLAGLLL